MTDEPNYDDTGAQKAEEWGDKALAQPIERKAYAKGFADALRAVYPAHAVKLAELQGEIDLLKVPPHVDLQPHE